MTSQVAPRLSGAFQNAKQDFLASLKDPSLFNSVSNIKSIDEVYAFAAQLQQDQSKREGLRHLCKIAPYLDRLKQYAGVIEVFIQAKPDILALIWGPIKLLLQMSDNLTQSFDAIVEAITGIGNKLPLFEAYTNIFETTDRVLDVLVLFYKDILDFYEIVLNFFAAKRWVIVFDSVWPRYKAKINVVVSSIERHSLLMTEEVSLANISEARAARIADMDRWQRTFEFQEAQDFLSVQSYISPNLYDDELDRLQRRICERTGRWLQREQVLNYWLDASNAATRVLWMQGIPGAGKTHIASMMVEKLRQSSKTVLFAFLSYRGNDVTPVSIIHSLMFQLAIGDDQFNESLKRDLRAKISNAFRSSQRNLKSNTRFARETLTELLKCVGPAYIILDGLDEVSKSEYMVDILNELLQVLDDSTEVKLFISSRAQEEIGRTLKKASAKEIRVDERNSGCIHAYVSVTTENWLSQSGYDQKDCGEIKSLLTPLSTKARGMFLYARVVMDNVQMCYTSEMVKSELRVLPEDLHEAVLDRLNKLPPSSSTLCRRALGWIGCTPVSITVEEMSFALSLDPDGKRDLPRSESLLNVVGLCGPIVEISNGYVSFVHFTVKEYLFDKENDTFLHALEATTEMTKTCLYYLSSDIFDIGIEPEMIEENILTGLYRLHWFATTQWIVLLQECERLLGSCDLPEPLLLALKHFAHECENGNFEGTVDLSSQSDHEFSTLRQKEPALQRLLVQELHFRRMDVGDWKVEDDDEGIFKQLIYRFRKECKDY
ncbi:NACHT nucleoside triphosphatase [Penicillium canariense]|uniref:NACHT nucleoside triphosphatase n=1 Tax=Penicillium canariense TaxID=189055 RepID=A0A9W9IF64_9EURO|nr:NACHT nucleoside triphosphatase [Penicillium canariense]KAJ5175558.1 NACHT nucleoside triphosphatase [Penicillium canariense]